MNSVRVLLEAISDNPWAAVGLATWLLFLLAIITTVAQECLALIVTRSRPVPPMIDEHARAAFGADANPQ